MKNILSMIIGIVFIIHLAILILLGIQFCMEFINNFTIEFNEYFKLLILIGFSLILVPFFYVITLYIIIPVLSLLK